MEYNRKEKKWESQYWHPTVTTDSVVFGFEGEGLHILLIKRNLEPFKDKWALPGGFIREEDITAKDDQNKKEDNRPVNYLLNRVYSLTPICYIYSHENSSSFKKIYFT